MVDLYEHQTKAVKELGNGKILIGGVGSGKTRVALSYYSSKISKKIKCYVITTAATRDKLSWQKEAALFNVEIVVDSWNNVKKYTSINNSFFIFDEQRAIGSGQWAKSFITISKKNKWILLSATPGDDWIDWCSIFIANGYFKNRTEFILNHVIYKPWSNHPEIQGYRNTNILMKYRNDLIVTMPYEKLNTRHRTTIKTSYDKNKYDRIMKDRWNIYADKPIETPSELCSVLRRVCNTSEDKSAQLIKILKQNKRVIIFYNFNYELDILIELMESLCVPYAQWNGKKHEVIPDTSSWAYLVQYNAGAEGWNCTLTNVIVFYSLNYSYKKMEQSEGRIDRINSDYKNMYYYYLSSDSPIDKAVESAINKKKKFNESMFSKFAENTYAIIEGIRYDSFIS